MPPDRTIPIEERLARLERTPGAIEQAIGDRPDAKLGRRPDERNWSAKEIVCHLRDVEELFQIRFHNHGARRSSHLGAGGDAHILPPTPDRSPDPSALARPRRVAPWRRASQNTKGERWTYPLWQQMLHQVNHATQHRSEAAFLLTQAGHSPGWLDFLYYIDLQNSSASGDR